MTDTQTKLSDRALAAYEVALDAKKAQRERAAFESVDERRIAVAVTVFDTLGVQIDESQVWLNDRPLKWIDAVVDVEDITLALCGYGAGRELNVLYRCETCGIRRTAIGNVTDLAELGHVLRAPRFVNPCICRSGAERWRTGGVRLS